MTNTNGSAPTALVKALGQRPDLLAMVVLVGLLLYIFGERISHRIDNLSARIDVCACGAAEPQP